MWCPDCQLNIAAIKQLTLLQPKIHLAIIGKELAENNLLQALNLEVIKIPLVIVLTNDYQPLETFIERPKTVLKHDDFSEIKYAYFEGDYLVDTMIEVVNKLPI